jgi:hypothetical protein
MLSPEQRDQFDRDGIVKVESAFTESRAAHMRAVVWEEMKRRYGMERADSSSWHPHSPTGMKSSKKHPAFAAIFGPPLCGVLDDLFRPGQWTMPRHAGQVLVTMPNATEWRIPPRLWHSDFLYVLPHVETVSAVKVWAMFERVGPGGGGTVQLAGSHRLMERYLRGRSGDDLDFKRVRDGFMGSHPWLKALTNDDGYPERNARFMVTGASIEGISLRVVELTGKPGDIFVTQPWVMHAAAPNATEVPRMMRSVAVYHTEYARSATDPAS